MKRILGESLAFYGVLCSARCGIFRGVAALRSLRELQLDESRDGRIEHQDRSLHKDYFLPGSNILVVEDRTFGAF